MGEELVLHVLTEMLTVSLQKGVSPAGGRSTDRLSLSPEGQKELCPYPGEWFGLKILGFTLLPAPVCY